MENIFFVVVAEEVEVVDNHSSEMFAFHFFQLVYQSIVQYTHHSVQT